MVDLIGSHEKFLSMKINASTATVIQIPRPQSKKFSVPCRKKDDNTYYPLDVHAYTCTDYLSPDSFLWREVEGASVGQTSLNHYLTITNFLQEELGHYSTR